MHFAKERGRRWLASLFNTDFSANQAHEHLNAYFLSNFKHFSGPLRPFEPYGSPTCRPPLSRVKRCPECGLIYKAQHNLELTLSFRSGSIIHFSMDFRVFGLHRWGVSRAIF